MHDILRSVKDIPGWLLDEDVSELYRLAQGSPGPVLEIGTYCGKSAVVMASAIRDAGRNTLVYTLDVDRPLLKRAFIEAQRRHLEDRIIFVRATAPAFARAYPHLRPGLTFVDGKHTYDGVARDLGALRRVVPRGGLIVMHDFQDPRNVDPSCPEIKVRPAVEASWIAAECEFGGTFGASGLFKRVTSPPEDGSHIIDLLRLANPLDQLQFGVRLPAARSWRALRGSRP